jgi:uncharacterized protein (DUF2252 family)
MRTKRFFLTSILLISILQTSCAGRGTVVHRVTVVQHDFLAVVTAFEDSEVAAHEKGLVSDDLHRKMQEGVKKVALADKDLDAALAANASSATLKAKLDTIYSLLDSLNSDGILGVKDVATKATLEIALDAIKSLIDNALVQVQ